MTLIAQWIVLVICVSCVSSADVTHYKSGGSENILGKIGCTICELGIDLIQELIKLNKTVSEIETGLVDFCTDTNIEERIVCKGAISEFLPEVLPILESQAFSSTTICTFLKICQSSIVESSEESIPLSLMKLLALKKETANYSLSLPRNGNGYILHMSDVHFDPYYEPGTNANCGTPLCCRTMYGPGNAGKWGDYNCDIPLWTAEMLFQATRKMSPQPDFVVFTGDYTPHDVWNQTKEYIQERLTNFSQVIAKYYSDLQVFPVLGNHDTFPVDQFNVHAKDSVHYDDFLWLRNLLANVWSPFLPPDAIETLRYGGYYTVLARTGLRFVVLNTQWGDGMNFYLLLNEHQAQNQSDWLVQVLQSAKVNGEKVIILGHIPSQDSFDGDYERNYIQIISDYSDIIVSQFFGHTHEDHFEIIKNVNGTPINMAYMAPSVTTYQLRNPSFRMYEYNTSTFEIVDFYQYITNLTLANESGTPPQWYLEYSAKEEYSLPDLSPSSWQTLVDNMQTDENLFNKFWLNFCSSIPSACDAACQKSYLCELQNALPDGCGSR